MNDQKLPGAHHPSNLLVTPVTAHPVVDEDTQAFLDCFAQDNGLSLHVLGHEEARQLMADLQISVIKPLPVAIHDFTVDAGVFGEVGVRIIRAEDAKGSLPIIFYLHGGGWVLGDRGTHDRLIRELALRCSAAVVFVEYATEASTRFPVQNEQAYVALCHIVANASALGLIGDRLAVAGDGAGGNMAAVMTLLTKRRRGPRIVFQLLLYPVMGLPDLTASYREFEYGPWLTGEAMRHYVARQFPDEVLNSPEALPGNSSARGLEGLPPALIISAENDVLRDEGEAYARKLIQAGVAVTAVRYIGSIHDFMVLENLADTPAARAATLQACMALKTALYT